MEDQSDKKPTITFWFPGGTPETMQIARAHKLIAEANANRTYAWESRVPGEDAEATWESGEHEHRTLEEAVDKAIPAWRSLGLAFEQAVLAAMDAGLVLSTGAECSELFHGTDGQESGEAAGCNPSSGARSLDFGLKVDFADQVTFTVYSVTLEVTNRQGELEVWDDLRLQENVTETDDPQMPALAYAWNEEPDLELLAALGCTSQELLVELVKRFKADEYDPENSHFSEDEE